MRAFVIAALLLALLSGCASTPVTIHTGELPPRSLAEPPDLVVGEWWTYDVTTTLGSPESRTNTVVMAGSTNTTWLLGLPADAFDDMFLIGHMPFVGELNRTTFTFPVHDEMVQFLQFPLDEGQSWQTPLFGNTGVATVTSVEGDRLAHIEVLAGEFTLRMVYDAAAGAFSRFETPFALVELVGHGTGHTGEVLVPVNQQTPIFTGRGLVVLDPGRGPMVGAPVPIDPKPVELHEVDDRQAGALYLFAGNRFLEPATPGLYAAEAVAPDDARYSIMRGPQDGIGVSTAVFHVEEPGGQWKLAFSALGVGATIVELLTYDIASYTLEGPDGHTHAM